MLSYAYATPFASMVCRWDIDSLISSIIGLHRVQCFSINWCSSFGIQTLLYDRAVCSLEKITVIIIIIIYSELGSPEKMILKMN